MIPPTRWHCRKQCLCPGWPGLRCFDSSLPPWVWPSQLFTAWNKGRPSSCSQPSDTRHRLGWLWTRPFLPSPTLPEAEQPVLPPFLIFLPGTGALGGISSLGLNQTFPRAPFGLQGSSCSALLTPECWMALLKGLGTDLTPPAGPCCLHQLLTSWSLFRARLKEGYFSSITWFLHWGLKNKRKRTQTHNIPFKLFSPKF